MTFLLTGTCAFGNRAQCQATIETLSGINAGSVTKSLNYLVLGTYVTDSWAQETFGRKIEKAMEYRDSGVPLVIVTEEHWVGEAGLARKVVPLCAQSGSWRPRYKKSSSTNG